VIDRADVKEAWEKQGALPLKMSPAELDKFLRADIESGYREVGARDQGVWDADAVAERVLPMRARTIDQFSRLQC
jgi:hypothetical protein